MLHIDATYLMKYYLCLLHSNEWKEATLHFRWANDDSICKYYVAPGMTWKGAGHIQCHTNNKKKKRMNFPTTSAHMHVHVYRVTTGHMALRDPLPPHRGPKQTGSEKCGCWHCWLGCRCPVWRMRLLHRAPATGCKHSAAHSCMCWAFSYTVYARQGLIICNIKHAGTPNKYCTSSSHCTGFLFVSSS